MHENRSAAGTGRFAGGNGNHARSISSAQQSVGGKSAMSDNRSMRSLTSSKRKRYQNTMMNRYGLGESSNLSPDKVM